VLSLTSWRTRSSGILRALATRHLDSAAPARYRDEAAAGSGDEVDRNGACGFSAFSLSTSSLTRSFSALLVGRDWTRRNWPHCRAPARLGGVRRVRRRRREAGVEYCRP